MTPFFQNKWNPILKVFTPEVNFIMKQGAVYSRIRVTRLERPALLLPFHKVLRASPSSSSYVMELGHLLTRSSLTYPEVSSKVCHDSFCQLGNRTWGLKAQSLRKQFTFTFFLLHNGNTHILQLHWSTKILSHEEECLFLMYFWMLNSNIFKEFFYHPYHLHCIRLCESTSLHMWVTGGL
jgi:hypothetical protein